ncbi:MAG: L,D-transpeptidase, partial [Coriobacteriales bacterium]
MACTTEAVERRAGHSRLRIALILCAIMLCAAFFTCAGNSEDAYAGDYLLKVNRQENVVTAYAKDSNGNYTVPVRAMLCITGENNATPLGTYHIGPQYRWKIMIGGVWSQYASRFNGDILLHSITYYDAYDKSTMKVERWNRLGTQMSLGCVNLACVDAKWIYYNCDPGTTVIVYASSNPGPLGKPRRAPIYEARPN